MRRVALRVRARRAALGLTAKELAERSGLSPRFISQLENGRANIALGRLDAVAQVLGYEVADLVASELWTIKSIPMVAEDRVERWTGRRTQWPIALLGMRGAGKTTIGILIADALRWPFMEVDHTIQDLAGLDLGQIFSVHGEDYYRRLEAVAVGDLLGRRDTYVIAASGGVVTNGPAYAFMKQECITVWLRTSPEEHMARVLGQGDSRPVAERERPMDELRAMLSQRESLYAQADLVLDTSDGSPESAAEELLRAIEAVREERIQLAR